VGFLYLVKTNKQLLVCQSDANKFSVLKKATESQLFAKNTQQRKPSHKLNRLQQNKRLHKNTWCLTNLIFGINWVLSEVRMEILSLQKWNKDWCVKSSWQCGQGIKITDWC